jgi:MerR family transcriptional regulator/heat shock protein HspR
MVKEFWTVTEIVELFEVKESFLAQLEEEEILCPIRRGRPPAKVFSAMDLEKLRLAKTLVEEMEVNLPGVEIVLRMRQNMIDMRRQFDAILEDLVKELQESFKKDLGV